MALRSALGASAFRVARQMLTESLLLALLGGGLGMILGQWLLAAIRSVIPERQGNSQPALMEIGPPPLFLALALALLTSLLFGLAPLWLTRRVGAGFERRRAQLRRRIAAPARAICWSLLKSHCRVFCWSVRD